MTCTYSKNVGILVLKVFYSLVLNASEEFKATFQVVLRHDLFILFYPLISLT